MPVTSSAASRAAAADDAADAAPPPPPPLPSPRQILLFVPNLIGYARIAMLLYGFAVASPPVFLVLYAVQAILDGIDGYAARKLNQCSAFGAWFDVVIDVFGRTCLWCLVSPHMVWLGCVEWLCFVCTHASAGQEWKTNFGPAPLVVERVMQRGFKTPLGVCAITGVHVLPIWIYFAPVVGLPAVLHRLGVAVLVCFRLLAFTVELYFITLYVRRLLAQPPANRAPSLAADKIN